MMSPLTMSHHAKSLPVIARFMSRLNGAAWIPILLARLVVGVMFCGSGWGKLHDVQGFGDWFAELGILFPHLNAAFVAALEFVGGACLVVGLGTRVFSLLLAFTMLVALWTVGPQSDAKTLGDWLYKSETLLTVILIWLTFVGSAKFSFDNVVARKLGAKAKKI